MRQRIPFFRLTSFWLYSLLALLAAIGLHSVKAGLPTFPEEVIYLAQPLDVKGFLKASIYFLLFAFSAFAIFSLAVQRRRLLAYITMFFIAMIYSIDLFIRFVGSNTQGLSTELFTLAVTESSRSADLLIFRGPLFKAALAFIIIFNAFYILRNIFKLVRIPSWLANISFIIAASAVFMITLRIPSIVNQSFPAPVKLFAASAEHYLHRHEQVARHSVDSILVKHQPQYQTIVWLIDESVTGSFLSVNGYPKPTTPFLDSQTQNSQILNYGVVNSISNCSNSSNLLLRIGLTTSLDADFRQALRELPTIFQYAAHAGFETILLDGQVAQGQLQNHLTLADRRFIDHYITYQRHILPREKDRAILASLQTLLDQPMKKRFIVAVKWGSHWPYLLNYPPQAEIFKPALRESLADMSERNAEPLLNAYANSLRYASDQFLESLLSERSLENTIMFYTSDHGQSFFYDDGQLTHCHYAKNPADLPQDEFRVPLLVFTPNAMAALQYNPTRGYSQEYIFPTTLQMMGYDESIYSRLGPTLLEGRADPAHAESFILDSGEKIQIQLP